MLFLALIQSFDMARVVVLLQGLVLLYYILRLLMVLWSRTVHKFFSFAPLYSWLLIVSLGVYDTYTKLGDPVIEWWRSPIRGLAYAIGIAGAIYAINKVKKLPSKDSSGVSTHHPSP